ncbi:hypothetical protein VSH64_48355 [Amycolatopsis rhabdoformis]|uniref:Uncharacterized protein n=1 Tax=Amycolatopsis rhabdoformis TaxID=1448059 RepID=A0ABZ1IAQ7_9PSEU|nr:hypothetical protein [Amycolatopsis rhabdoformis]WSE30520.1 hypothetical protein VSH64_48355 [Amycolatopsis rhabdoformis]
MSDVIQPTKVSISGRVSFEQEITATQAAQIIAFIDSFSGNPPEGMESLLLPPKQSPQPLQIAAPPAAGGLSSPREALELSGAKTNPERIVAFALYIAQQGGRETFTTEDIKPLFRQAREPIPGNISRDLDGAIKAGWITESDTRGEYYVVGKALSVLESGFDGIRTSRGNGSKQRQPNGKTGRKSKDIPEVFKSIESFSSSIEGYGDYHKLTKKSDKFLWAINAAKLQGVPSLTNQEVVWLTDHLGDGIPANNIAGNVRQHKKAGYVNRTLQDDKIRILPAGEEYLKGLKD